MFSNRWKQRGDAAIRLEWAVHHRASRPQQVLDMTALNSFICELLLRFQIICSLIVWTCQRRIWRYVPLFYCFGYFIVILKDASDRYELVLSQVAFSQIALAFRCDQYTLKQRLQAEEHARNLAEENIQLELSRGRETLEVQNIPKSPCSVS